MHLCDCFVSASAVTGQSAVQDHLNSAPAVRPTAPRQLWPIRNITCCYDEDTGLITGLRFSRFSSKGEALTSRTGRCSINSPLTSIITLPPSADVYITGVNATYTELSLLSVKFLLSNNRQRTCTVSRASYNPIIRARRIKQRQRSAAGLTAAATAAAYIDQGVRRLASSIGLAQSVGVWDGPVSGYAADKPAGLAVKRVIYEGPVLYGRKAGLATLRGICDPRSR